MKHFIKCGRHYIAPSRIMAVGPLDEKTLGASAVLVETGQAATLMQVQDSPDAIAAKVEAACEEARKESQSLQSNVLDSLRSAVRARADGEENPRQAWE